VDFLLKTVDPYNNQRITYSEVVQLLSGQQVGKVTLLEKFVQKQGIDFEQIEMEMKIMR